MHQPTVTICARSTLRPPAHAAVNRRPRGSGRRRKARGGAAALEAALVLPIILALILGLFDYCRAIMVEQLAANAAREGARQAVANTTTLTTANIQAVVTQALGGQGLSAVAINVYQADPSSGNNLGPWNNAPTGSAIAVQVTASYQPMLSYFSLLPRSISVQATSIMTSEAT
jgi:Flp pilus assembly protein TadG